MAGVDSLHTHLVEELTDLRDAETQLTQALPKLAQSATSKRLHAAFQKRLKETRTHLTRIDQALRALGETASSKTCAAMKGLLKEGETHMKRTPAGVLRDAVMITSAQKGRALRDGQLRHRANLRPGARRAACRRGCSNRRSTRKRPRTER